MNRLGGPTNASRPLGPSPKVGRDDGKGSDFEFRSLANSVVVNRSSQPWTDMFDNGNELAPDWRALIIRHRARFVLGFDNVWSGHWGPLFTDQVTLWRNALNKLPHPVAHAIAHGNAERLWRLAPATFVGARQ